MDSAKNLAGVFEPFGRIHILRLELYFRAARSTASWSAASV
jgi:hypothetical protein